MARREQVGIDITARDQGASTTVDKVGRAIRNLDSDAKKAASSGGGLKGLGGVMSGLKSGIFAGFGISLASSVSRAVGSVKQSIFGMNANLETAGLQFETLMGSADKANAHVRGLFDFAAKTPFETAPVIEASRIMETFGGATLDSTKNLNLIGDAAAATSAPLEEVAFWTARLYADIKGGRPFGEAAQRLTELGILTPQVRNEMEALQKTQGKTKATTADVAQAQLKLADAQLKVREAAAKLADVRKDKHSTALDEQRAAINLAKAQEKARDAGLDLQKTTASMNGTAKQGGDAWGKYQEALGRFDGSMAKQAESWKGLTSSLSDNAALIAATTFKPVFDTAKAGMKTLLDFISTDAMSARAARWADRIGQVINPANLVRLQARLSAAFGSIDWAGIRTQAGALVDTFVRFATQVPWDSLVGGLQLAAATTKEALAIFNSLPDPVKAALVGAFAVNKLTGGGLGSLAKEGLSLAGNVLGGGGIGGFFARGANPTNPLWVASATGGIGDLAGTGGETLAYKIGGVIGNLIKVFGVVMVAQLAEEIHKQISPGGGLEGRTQSGNLLPGDELMWPFGPKNTPHVDLGPFKNILGGDSTFTLPAPDSSTIDHPGAEGMGGQVPTAGVLSRMTGFAGNGGKLADDRTAAAMLLDETRRQYHDAVALLRNAKTPEEIKKAVAGIVEGMVKHGFGNVANTKQRLAELRAVLATTDDPTTRRAIESAIHQIERLLPNREHGLRQLQAAERIANSSRSTKDKLAELTRIHADLVNRKLPGQARTVQAKIDALRVEVSRLPSGIARVMTGFAGNRGKAADDLVLPRNPLAGQGKREYASGAWSVPGTGAALVHDREMILPAALASAVRASLVRPGRAAGPTSIVNLQIVNHFGPSSVRSREDIRDISTSIARRAALQGMRVRPAVAGGVG